MYCNNSPQIVLFSVIGFQLSLISSAQQTELYKKELVHRVTLIFLIDGVWILFISVPKCRTVYFFHMLHNSGKT